MYLQIAQVLRKVQSGFMNLVKDRKSRSISKKGVTIRKHFQFVIVKAKE